MVSTSRRVSNAQLVSFALLGVLAGLSLGYVFIGSIQRVLRISARHQLLERTNAEKGYLRRAAVHEQPDHLPKRRESSLADRTAQSADRKTQNGFPATGDTIHTLCTSNGSPYLNFQTRIMYGTYKLVQDMPGGDKLVAFTRILHRTKPDILVDEVPTFRADPLTPKCDGWCEFPVSDRPNAVAQFFSAAKKDPSMIKAPWLLMLEGDYVWMKPLQAPKAESAAPSWAFPYSYIAPAHSSLESVMRIMYPAENGPLEHIPNSGPAPVLMRVEEWIKIMPDYERLTAHIEAHAETKDKLGWVREMYAFSIATALQKIKIELEMPPNGPLIVQPPADSVLGNAALMHYTWGLLVEDAQKTKVWVFDKREYVAPEIEQKPPKIPLPPPRDASWKLHDGEPWTAELAELTILMLTQMNRAIEKMPVLKPKNLQRQ